MVSVMLLLAYECMLTRTTGIRIAALHLLDRDEDEVTQVQIGHIARERPPGSYLYDPLEPLATIRLSLLNPKQG